MSEIPMPASVPYQPAPPKSSGYGTCCKIAAVVCVVFIIAMVIIAMVFWGGVLSLFGGIFGGIPGGGTSYDTRSIATYSSTDVDIYPIYYYAEFDVYSSETQTSISPDVLFDINVSDTGTDSVSVTIHYAIYNIDSATVFGAATWAELDTYLVDDGSTTSSAYDFINLNNYADTYTWVLWFEASSKTVTWSVDIDLTLRYNW
ncbi:MAG: hypothetical protein ACW98U_14880 [Candidatus Thorarchaeota archaeon]